MGREIMTGLVLFEKSFLFEYFFLKCRSKYGEAQTYIKG